ncbi:MAG: ABC transporter ATP-binding protein [Candidatus Eremiobacteraeota bacterium]|nr:ABC transporter ATP-binding protein [Candidatus Eremiobacteraeota bacterium]
MTAAVAIDRLAVRYDGFVALHDVSLQIQSGEALGIVGPNGSGKSTLLKTIAGLLQPSSGEVRVFDCAPKALVPGSIAYVPQIEAVDWSFPVNVWDVVAMARFPRLRFWQRFSSVDRQVVEHALELVNMTKLGDRQIAQLSGGQQQRVFVARAIAQQPRLLLLDEPTTGVDAATEDALRKVVRDLTARGLPVIMTTHDLDRANEWFDRLVVLDRTVIAVGKPEQVLASGAYAAIREHTHTHGHLRTDHPAHDEHASHPEIAR